MPTVINGNDGVLKRTTTTGEAQIYMPVWNALSGSRILVQSGQLSVFGSNASTDNKSVYQSTSGGVVSVTAGCTLYCGSDYEQTDGKLKAVGTGKATLTSKLTISGGWLYLGDTDAHTVTGFTGVKDVTISGTTFVYTVIDGSQAAGSRVGSLSATTITINGGNVTLKSDRVQDVPQNAQETLFHQANGRPQGAIGDLLDRPNILVTNDATNLDWFITVPQQ